MASIVIKNEIQRLIVACNNIGADLIKNTHERQLATSMSKPYADRARQLDSLMANPNADQNQVQALKQQVQEILDEFRDLENRLDVEKQNLQTQLSAMEEVKKAQEGKLKDAISQDFKLYI